MTHPPQVAKWGQAFDMKVLGFDPVLPAASFRELGIQKADLDKIWPHVRAYMCECGLVRLSSRPTD